MQSGFVREKEIQFGKQLREQVVKLEEKNVKQHAETTKNLYEEISAALKARFRDEERAKLTKQREKLEQDFRRQLQVRESEFAQLLALERKEASKVSLKNVTLEEDLRRLEHEKELWSGEKENMMKQQAELELMPVRGADGKCKRCEALIIASGQAIQTVKKLKRENQMLKNKLDH